MDEDSLLEAKKRVRSIDRTLAAAFGEKLSSPKEDVALELVHAILSQNTSRKNYELAYSRLIKRYPTPERIANASLADIEEAIRPGGLSKQKALSIKKALLEIKRKTGGYSLDFLKGSSVSDGRAFLTSLPGVGPKTASVVLMFAAGKKVLPVDTHVLRTSKRLGLIGKDTSAENAEQLLEGIVSAQIRPRLHLNLVRLGREVCRARLPLCGRCPVGELCPSRRILWREKTGTLTLFSG